MFASPLEFSKGFLSGSYLTHPPNMEVIAISDIAWTKKYLSLKPLTESRSTLNTFLVYFKETHPNYQLETPRWRWEQ